MRKNHIRSDGKRGKEVKSWKDAQPSEWVAKAQQPFVYDIRSTLHFMGAREKRKAHYPGRTSTFHSDA